MPTTNNVPATTAGAGPAPPREHWWPLADRPLLVLCLCFLAGIWLADACRLPLACWALLGVAGGASGLTLGQVRLGRAALCLGALACGALLHAWRTLPHSDDVRLFAGKGAPVMLDGYVTAELPPLAEQRRFMVAARTVAMATGPQSVSGNVLVCARTDAPPLDGVPVRCQGTCAVPAPAANPGQLDYAALLARRHVSLVLRSASVERIAASRLPLAMWVRQKAAAARGAILKRLQRSVGGANRSLFACLIAGIVWGMQVAPIPEAVADSFRRTGTVHVLVVSGAQVTLLAWLVLVLPGRRWPGARWYHTVAIALPLAFFALMVGLGPSVSRAVAMCLLLVLSGGGRVRYFDFDAYTALGLAAVLICAFDTSALFSIGGQLSFAATLGVVLGLGCVRQPGAGWWGRARFWALSLGASAAGAWTMTTPLLAHYFQTFPLLGALANLAVVPLAALVMTLSCFAMPLTFVWMRLAALVSQVIRALVAGMLGANSVCAGLPWAYASEPRFPTLACVAWYGIVALGVMTVRGKWWQDLSPKRWLALGLAVALALSLWFALSGYRQPALEVTFLDVGHGQCCVVRSPAGRIMMVDAGSGERATDGERCAREVILPFLASRGIGRLDVAVLTHRDADHCNALPTVLAQIPTGLVVVNGPEASDAVRPELQSAVRSLSIPMQAASAGGRIDLGGGVSADVLWPTGTDSDRAFRRNDRCVVLQVRYGETSLLLPADIEEDAQRELLRRRCPLAAQVLQVPHHGSRYAQNRQFLHAVRPLWAVISCPAGDPNLPHYSAVRKLEEAGAEIRRTDLDGAVTILSDGVTVRVRTHLRRAAQNRSPVWAAAWSRASRIGSGSAPATSAAGGESLSPTASSIRRANLLRTSGVSSNLRVRNRRIAATSSPESWRAEALTNTSRSSGGAGAEGSATGAAASGISASRSFTTTVPAAMSPTRFARGWKKENAPPMKYRYGRKSATRSTLRTMESMTVTGVPSSCITRMPTARFPGV